jgi:hypothetical protein
MAASALPKNGCADTELVEQWMAADRLGRRLVRCHQPPCPAVGRALRYPHPKRLCHRRASPSDADPMDWSTMRDGKQMNAHPRLLWVRD